MSDAVYIEMPQKQKGKPFFKRLSVLLIIFLLLISGGAAYLSWWLDDGKLSSVHASVDAVVYTVEPEEPITIMEVLVKNGENVFAGQPLAVIELASSAQNMSNQSQSPHSVMPLGEITGRLNASGEAERNMSARIAQARAQEERYQQAHQNYVTEHVRAQLRLRAIDPRDQVAWATASADESAARVRMEQARIAYEQVSKMRAAMDTELVRIRSEMLRKKAQASRSVAPPEEKKVKEPAQAKPVDTNLLSPANGVILQVLAAPGQRAQKDQSLFYILPTDQGSDGGSWIQAWFPISAQNKLKVGLPVNIKINNKEIAGRVAEISPESQPLPKSQARTQAGKSERRYILARIWPDSPADLAGIRPGEEAECRLQVNTIPGASWLK